MGQPRSSIARGAIKPDQAEVSPLDERIDPYQSIGWTTARRVVHSGGPAVALVRFSVGFGENRVPLGKTSVKRSRNPAMGRPAQIGKARPNSG